MRLLTTADAIGGVWTYALDLAAALAPHGIETLLAVLGPAPDAGQREAAGAIAGLRLIETGLPLDWLAEGEADVRASAAAIAALAAREAVDLVQLNQPALAAVPMPCPVVVVVHSCVATWWRAVGDGPMPAAFEWQTTLVRRGLARADAVACPSRAFADAVRLAYALPERPHVVHNGRRARAMGTGRPAPIAFTAGRLWDAGKDVATLDRAAARLTIPLDAAGPMASPSGEAIALDHLRGLGRLGDDALDARLAERPVFVSAARYEPFGLAVLEAAQAGCALVLADMPTFRELWEGAATFVGPGDDVAFADAITALIEDESARTAQGESARARAGRYTPGAMAAAMAGLYREAAGRRAAA